MFILDETSEPDLKKELKEFWERMGKEAQTRALEAVRQALLKALDE